MTSSILNSIGLILDIIGATGLFFFGLPSKLNLQGSISLEGDITDKEKRENKVIKICAHIALVFLILGFIFQLASDFC